MQNKILILATLCLSLYTGKEQKPDEIHEQDPLKKKSDFLSLIFRRNSSKQICSAVK